MAACSFMGFWFGGAFGACLLPEHLTGLVLQDLPLRLKEVIGYLFCVMYRLQTTDCEEPADG